MAVNVTLVLGYCVVQNATLRFWTIAVNVTPVLGYWVVQNAILSFCTMAVNVTPVLLCGSDCYFPFLDDSKFTFLSWPSWIIGRLRSTRQRVTNILLVRLEHFDNTFDLLCRGSGLITSLEGIIQKLSAFAQNQFISVLVSTPQEALSLAQFGFSCTESRCRTWLNNVIPHHVYRWRHSTHWF